ncbi:BREX system serine/threonine kinase PglW [Nocardiopsis sp. HNM0947]|uniref:BREX system serine/threonine kinase PglW n=1 Tax=Nocardiopsis coralli TaxID=2772213 RepID=A0ABR9P1I5_9ACTN|nr:BREX system serine/threonine kinase PglW [Nocardiopsis coralli]MBE2997699.1 BREX system serine/threonine kinase PglW [Nocardiopsis coralli]
MPDRWWDNPSEFPWEQAALDHVKESFLRHGTSNHYRAWPGFTFTAHNQRIRECDLFMVTPTGAFLVEIKSHPGHVVNRGNQWTFSGGDRFRRRTITNPLHLTDQKAKELKSRLQWAVGQLNLRVTVPFIEAGVFLSDPGLRAEFDEVQQVNVFGRDGKEQQTRLPGIWDRFLGAPKRRVDPDFLRHVSRLMEKIGIVPMDRAMQLGEYNLAKRSMDSGPTWTDYEAEHARLGSETRVRLYHYGEHADADERRSVEKAAKREYMSLGGISHEGIVKAEYFGVLEESGKDLGPAIAFAHRKSWQQLDHFMADRGAELQVDTRMEMVRQLAEAVNHAHRNRLYHRALAARSVWVEMDGNYPRLHIADWQVASRESVRLRGGRTGQTSGATAHLEEALGSRALAAHVERAAAGYLAPEFPDYTGRAAPQDLFGLGALTYLIFTGRPPARDRPELSQAIQEHGCLTPAAVSDDIIPQLDTLVREATQRSPGERMATVPAFLRGLDVVEEYLTLPEVITDPLNARRGDQVVQGWKVSEVLGKGATARALLMHHERTGRELVYKVALNQESAARALRAEAETLRAVGSHPRIVRPASAEEGGTPGIQEVGERTVLLLERAGQRTLADYLARQGSLTTGELRTFGQHLFESVEFLEDREEEVFHRDIKPANLGVHQTPKKARALVLYDFSLSRTPVGNTSAGTRGYLDPFLGPNRPYDAFAERYALAVTLHEMATGELPVWDEDGVDPEFLDSEVTVPRLSKDALKAFPGPVEDAFRRFFHTSLHRRTGQRFASLSAMREAWEGCFHTTSHQEAKEEDEETLRRNMESAEAATPLHLAGLTPLAVDTARRILRCETVGELLRRPVRDITHMRGSTLAVRNELNRAATYWRKRLDVAEYAVPTPARLPSGADDETKRSASLDQVLRQFLPVTTDDNREWVGVVRELIGLPEGKQGYADWWPTRREVAERLGLTTALVDRSLDKAHTHWSKNASLLGSVRGDVEGILERGNRVGEVRQIASELLAMRGSSLDGYERAVFALAVVRVLVEYEAQRQEQRFVVRRFARGVIAAQVIDDDPTVPVESDLLDYAALLGRRADQLVDFGGADSLPGPGTVRDALRAVDTPEGMEPWNDTALVRTAVAASERAEATPRLELYPDDLDLDRALRITQAVGYLGRPGIKPEQIQDRVRSRFPALPTPQEGQLRELLRARHPHKLREDVVGESVRWFIEPEFTTYEPSTHTGHREPGRVDAVSQETWERLGRAVERGGYRALKTWLPDTERSAEQIGNMPGVVPFDVSAEFVQAMDEVRQEKGKGLTWRHLTQADSSRPRPRPFQTMLELALQRVGERVREAGSAAHHGHGVVLLHRATPLARYEQGRALLGRLAEEARESGRSPHGLWLLCPMRGPQSPALLDGEPAGIIADAEQVLLPRGFSAPEPLLMG